MHALDTMPITLEDRTGATTNTDFDDIYDRAFIHVARTPGQSATKIYQMPVRASRQRSARATKPVPVISLDFAPGEALGTITFAKQRVSMPMSRYLCKTSFFGSSLSRQFVGTDGRTYKWSYRVLDDHEWTCSTADESNYLVAHYLLRPPNVPIYDVSGNTLVISPHFAHLSCELVASLLTMRHIAQFNL